LRDVVTAPGEGEAGAAAVLGAGVPFAMIEQGPASVGAAFSPVPHPASANITPASGATTFLRSGVRITRR